MLSTTWRSYEDMRGHLIHAFKEIGGEEFSNAVIGDTIQKVFDTRGQEIKYWLEEHDTAAYVIFEDSKDHI